MWLLWLHTSASALHTFEKEFLDSIPYYYFYALKSSRNRLRYLEFLNIYRNSSHAQDHMSIQLV